MNVRDHVERIKAKPEHIRRQIALMISGGVTGLVALVWIGSVTTSDTFALKSDTMGGVGATDLAAATANMNANFSDLAAAATAAEGGATGAGLTIVETRASSTADRAYPDENRTSIPF